MPTTSHTLTDTWSKIGAGPMLIHANGANSCELHFAKTEPNKDAAFIPLHGTDGFSYGQEEDVYARAKNGACEITTVTEAE